MRESAAALTGLLFPVPAGRTGDAFPAQRSALLTLEVTRKALTDPQLARFWLETELRTLERAAQSVASDEGATPAATALRQSLFHRSLQTTMAQAREVSGRANVDPGARRRASALADSLHDIETSSEGSPGQGGQQVSFSAPGMDIEQARISGDNQYDRHVTWDSSNFRSACEVGRCSEVRARNWWFKGKVIVEYRLRGDRTTYSCHFYVNEQPAGNYWADLLAPEIPGPDGRCRAAAGR
jgi:hypothetical protein